MGRGSVLGREEGKAMKRTPDVEAKVLINQGHTLKSGAVRWKPIDFVKPYSFVKPLNLVKLPTFWSGVASITNPFVNTNFQLRRPVVPRISAWNAIHGDWDAIGFDTSKVIESFASKHPKAFPTQGQLFDPESTRDAS